MESMLKQQDTTSSFDFLALVFQILKYWYLFFIGALIAGGLAYLKNKSWTPTYRTTTTILIEDSRSGLRSDFTSGFSLSAGNRNITNQIIMFRSHDFVTRVVEQMNITSEIYIKQRFRNIPLYKNAPIAIESSYISNQAYGLEFKIAGIDEETFEISFVGNDNISAFRQAGKYGEPVQHNLFFIEVQKTDLFVNAKYELHFRFLSKGNLVSIYGGRLFAHIYMEGSSVLEIGVTGKIAERDVDFMNLLNQQFRQENLDRKNAAAELSIQFINRQIAIIKDSIDSSESKLNAFQLATGLHSQNTSQNRSRTLDELDLKNADLQLRKEYMKFMAEKLGVKDEPLVDPTVMQVANPQLSRLVTEYNNLVTQNKTLGQSSPLYSANLRVLEDLQAQIRIVIETMNSTIKIDEEEIQRRYAQARAEIARLPQQERQLLTYERDFKINDTYYTYLLQRRTESQIQQASNTPDNHVIDHPRVHGPINNADRQSVYTMYLLIGLLIPLLYVLCREFFFKFAVQSREEVEKITKLPLLGTIEKSDKKEEVVVKRYPRSSFTEGFRSLRSRMEYLAKKENPISLLVTSTEPQDGKTFIALNLSSIYQLGGKKVIVVDFDLRRPALTRSLGLENVKGLSNCLIGQIPIEEAIITTEYDFDVLPAGVIPPNPSELIRSKKTKEIIKSLYEQYDYVLLDCSPVGLVSDAHFLARLVDVVLFVVRNEKTNKNFMKYTVKELVDDGINNMAVIYNDVDTKVGYYGGRRYYGKSSYYLKHGNYYHND
jgi:capsular exopolysaccharide synthesis family protein